MTHLRKPLILLDFLACLLFSKLNIYGFSTLCSTFSTLGSGPEGNPESVGNTIGRCIEVVVTRLTRNQFGISVHGFELKNNHLN